MKKVLVTGATGFVGRHVINELKGWDCEILASSSGNKPWTEPGISHIALNLSSLDPSVNYYEYFQQPDLLIHLAWEGLPNYEMPFHQEVNLPRHFLLLQNLVHHGLRDITVTGTCFEYGLQEGMLSEDMQPLPMNSYAIAKNSLRIKLEELQHQHSFLFKWVRLFYMYGKGQNPKSLLSQLDRALDAGETQFPMSLGQQKRDYLPVEAVARYIVQIAMQNNTTGIINCCSGIPVTVQSFVEDYLHSIHREMKLKLGVYPYSKIEPFEFWGDTAKLKKITDHD